MSYEAILYETRGPVAIITLNRPERLNAIGQAVREEVHAAVQAAHEDDAVRAAIITGAGKGFCSGADLSGAATRAAGAAAAIADPAPRQTDRLDEMGWVGRWAKRFAHFDKPLIAAVNGVAAGAGMSMALACDVRVGSTNARFKTRVRRAQPLAGLGDELLPAAHRRLLARRRPGLLQPRRERRGGLPHRTAGPPGGARAADRRGGRGSPRRWRSGRRWRSAWPSGCCSTTRTPSWTRRCATKASRLGFARKATGDTRESIASFAEKRKGVYTGA